MWGLHCKVRGETWALLRLVEIDLEMAGGARWPWNARGCTAHSSASAQWESLFAGFVFSLAAALVLATRLTLWETFYSLAWVRGNGGLPTTT